MRFANGTTWVFGLMLTACTSAPVADTAYAALAVVEIAHWQAFDGDVLIGHVRQLEIQDPKGKVTLYRVEDLHGRWLGHASSIGRFTRRVPFQEKEQDLGVLSMERGATQLLEATALVKLKPVAVEADARRQR